MNAYKTITFPDGFNGHTRTMNAKIIKQEISASGSHLVKVQSVEGLIKWFRYPDYVKALDKGYSHA